MSFNKPSLVDHLKVYEKIWKTKFFHKINLCDQIYYFYEITFDNKVSKYYICGPAIHCGPRFFLFVQKKGVRSTQACFKKVFLKSDSHIDINKQKMLV